MKVKYTKKDYFTFICGVFCILYAIFSYIVYISIGNWNQLFPLCYLVLLIAGVGMASKNGYLILSQINILLIIHAFWSADFIYFLVSGKYLLGVTSYFFEETFIFQVISLQHVLFIPLSLICLYLIKSVRKDAWKFSIIEVLLVFPLTFFFTPANENINCVFKPCINLAIHVPYFIAWISVFVLLIIFTNYIMTLIPGFFKISKKKKR
ncbi:MAG: hypothetical protein WC402_03220 [Candidatus Pacearchaeota archaeon]|jgi:hypothetical protein